MIPWKCLADIRCTKMIQIKTFLLIVSESYRLKILIITVSNQVITSKSWEYLEDETYLFDTNI